MIRIIFLQSGDSPNYQLSLAGTTGNEFVDQAWVQAMMIRWSLAAQYLEEVEMDSLPEEHGIRILVNHDFPLLLEELTRLRPELTR